jgi:hypothetical protein
MFTKGLGIWVRKQEQRSDAKVSLDWTIDKLSFRPFSLWRLGAIRAVAPLQPLLFSPPFSPQKGRVKKKKKNCLNKKEYLSYLFLKPFVVFLFFQASRPERAGEVYPVKHGAQ